MLQRRDCPEDLPNWGERNAHKVPSRKVIFNLTRGDAVCVGEIADKSIARMRGLMGRRGLAAGEGLWLHPAPAIHTAFMRFPIDALFLDGEMRVLQIVERLRPWRMAAQRGARSVLELPAGESTLRHVQVGDMLELRASEGPVDRGLDDLRAGRARSILRARNAGARAVQTGLDGVEGEVSRLRPLGVAVVSSDPRFRAVMSVLLARRECAVTTASSVHRLGDVLERIAVQVVVLDVSHGEPAAWGTTVASLPAGLGVVLVSNHCGPGSDYPSAHPKWGPFAQLHAAIEQASRRPMEMAG